MTTLHSVFHRGFLALALLGTGIAGPYLLPQPAPVAEVCRIARDTVVVSERSSAEAVTHAMTVAQGSRKHGKAPRS